MENNNFADKIIEVLNDALERDPIAIQSLIKLRTYCGEKLAKHPTIQVLQGKDWTGLTIYTVSMLGIINGFFDNADGTIEACFDENGKLIKFKKIQKEDKD